MARSVGPLTEAIHKLLKKNPNITFSDAKPLLEKEGFESVSSGRFNVCKYNFLNPKKGGGLKTKVAKNKGKRRTGTKTGPAPQVSVAGSDVQAAFDLLKANGGLDRVKELVALAEQTISEVAPARRAS